MNKKCLEKCLKFETKEYGKLGFPAPFCVICGHVNLSDDELMKILYEKFGWITGLWLVGLIPDGHGEMVQIH